MNMRFADTDLLDAAKLDAGFARLPSRSGPFDRERVVGLVLAIVLHVVLAAALVSATLVAAHQIVPKSVTVNIEQAKPEAPPPVIPPPQMIQPHVETIAPPDVTIQTDAAAPITVQVQPQTPAVTHPDPPQPVSTETQASYLSRLLGHLNRYKRYPAAARSARIQGVVMLHFIMDKDGKVLTFDIAKSSGRDLLDQEALALIQRAQPLPPIPAGYGKDQINAVVPIEFSLH